MQKNLFLIEEWAPHVEVLDKKGKKAGKK